MNFEDSQMPSHNIKWFIMLHYEFINRLFADDKAFPFYVIFTELENWLITVATLVLLNVHSTLLFPQIQG